MILSRALIAIRSGVISHVRLPVGGVQAAAGSLGLAISRGFAEGSFLNKDDVTQRVLNVVKNFDKTDPAKARRPCPNNGVGLSQCSPVFDAAGRPIATALLLLHLVLHCDPDQPKSAGHAESSLPERLGIGQP